MPVTYKRQDDWDKMFEKFAKFDELEQIESTHDSVKDETDSKKG